MNHDFIRVLLALSLSICLHLCLAQEWQPIGNSDLYQETITKVESIEPFSKFLAIESEVITDPGKDYFQARWAFLKKLFITRPEVDNPNEEVNKFVKKCLDKEWLTKANKEKFAKAACILGFELITDRLAWDEPVENIIAHRNIPYVYHNGYAQRMDLFMPKAKKEEAIPCIIFIHGGGWRIHKRAWFESFARRAANHGYAAVTIDYRMLHAVESPLACVHDAKAAVRWIRANAHEYGIDPNRIGASGASAGAHLASLLATSGDVVELDGLTNQIHVSSGIQAAVGFATPALTGNRKTWPWFENEKPNWFDLISPYKYVSEGDAPMLFIHGTEDKTVSVEDAKDLHEAFRKNNIPAELDLIEEAGHVFYMNANTADKALVFFDKIFSNMNKYSKESEFLEAAQFHDLRGGLNNSFAKFNSGDSVRVAFLGGSITYNWGWRNMIMDYLKHRFPQTHFDFISAGIPSTGSTAGAFRLDHDILSKGKVDLLFQEAAVNDQAIGKTNTQIARATEGIVRRALISNPEMDVVLMYFVDPQKIEDYNNDIEPEVIRIHDRVANHYNLPSINLAKEVTARINAGEFDWENDFRNLHPSPFGQKVYFHSIRRLFETAWGVENSEYMDPPMSTKLPETLTPGPYDNGRYRQVINKKYGNGWTYNSSWEPSDKTDRTREGFVHIPLLTSDTPGSKLKIKFIGTAVGINNISGKDAGIIRFRIDNGAWQEQDLFTKHSDYVHLPRYFVLAENLELGKHVLELEIMDKKNSKSLGNACRIKYFLIN